MKNSVVFSNAVAKCNETRLLSYEQLTRLFGAPLDTAFKILRDYGYVWTGKDDIDAFIAAQIDALNDYIHSDCPSEKLERLLFLSYVYSNAKAAYKEKRGGTPSQLYKVDDYNEEILSGNYETLPPALSEYLRILDERQDVTSAMIDINLNKAQAKEELSVAAKDKLLLRFVRAKIDGQNIMAALRAKKMNLDVEDVKEIFIDGGKLSKEAVLSCLSEGKENALAGTEFSEIDFSSLPAAERDFDNILLKIAESNRVDNDSLSPFFSYCLRQLTEYKTVKMILVCCKSGAKDEIAARLRGFYE